MRFVDRFNERGLDELQTHLRIAMKQSSVMRDALYAVDAFGMSVAARKEAQRDIAVNKALERHMGISVADIDVRSQEDRIDFSVV